MNRIKLLVVFLKHLKISFGLRQGLYYGRNWNPGITQLSPIFWSMAKGYEFFFGQRGMSIFKRGRLNHLLCIIRTLTGNVFIF